VVTRISRGARWEPAIRLLDRGILDLRCRRGSYQDYNRRSVSQWPGSHDGEKKVKKDGICGQDTKPEKVKRRANAERCNVLTAGKMVATTR